MKEDAVGQADLVLDTIGGEVLARSPALLRPGGTLVTIKAAAQPPAGRDDIRGVVFVQESNRAQLIELARLVDQGHLRPQVGAVYPLAEAANAFTAKATSGIPGSLGYAPLDGQPAVYLCMAVVEMNVLNCQPTTTSGKVLIRQDLIRSGVLSAVVSRGPPVRLTESTRFPLRG